ncbi:protein phosphatase 1 regulatory subunit 12A-like isoform X13 [Asterias amurensis]|uniref:protein phosphatase 1 regulatory subunit 12A-like isoform X13 n=1 Tax=Asterias amurensis TaxID=7602 RepID=UPI003AB76AB3
MADTEDDTAVGSRPKSALMRRHEQLQRWKGSELDKEKNYIDPKRIKVKFAQGCVFLAACASGDTSDVKKMLAKGADINYANVDGLTALHQAVIDEKLEMVEFLVENGADIEAQDNEGWTALHAAASCGFMDIAQFLIDNRGNVAAVNNEGEIPLDLAEEEDMEEFLQEVIEKKGLDVENARNEEEQRMLTDANQWLNTKNIKERKHPKSGATSLHVAAAKGYIKVMSILIQAGANVDSVDNDGWTSLHAASHWGQKEAVEILVENMCEMSHKNKLGQTAFDLADDEMLRWLEELKKKQASMKKEEKHTPRIEAKNPPPFKRRLPSSLKNRPEPNCVPDRNMLLHQDMCKERRELELKIHGKESEKDKQAGIAKRKITPWVAQRPIFPDFQGTSSEKKTMQSSSSSESDSESSEDDSKNRPTKNRGNMNHNKPAEVNTRQANRSMNLPQQPVTPSTPSKKEVPSFSPKPLQPQRQDSKEDTPAWRQGLRKSGSASTVPEAKLKPEKEPEKIPRSASSPKLTTTEERAKQSASERQDRLGRLTEGRTVDSRVTAKTPEPKPEDKTGREAGLSSRGGSFTRRRIIADVTTDQDKGRDADRNTTITATITTSTTPPVTTATTTVPTTTTGRRSYMTPAKDDESETQRRARAKRERSSRRSTQGVTAEDLEGAKTAIREKKVDKEDKETKNELQKNEDGSEDSPLEDKEKSKPEEKPSDRYSRPLSTSSISSRYGDTSTTSSPSDRYASRSGSGSTYRDRDRDRDRDTDKATGTPCTSCKKIYDEKVAQVTKLQDQVKERDLEVAELKMQVEKSQQKSDRFDTKSVDNEKREKRALERRLSELEEELKAMEQLKADNQRLKDENGALVRVISKLSK